MRSLCFLGGACVPGRDMVTRLPELEAFGPRAAAWRRAAVLNAALSCVVCESCGAIISALCALRSPLCCV